MCIFSPPVSLVKGTNIFARHSEKSKQFLVYSMAYKANHDVAMILPLPVASHDENTAIRFIALDSYPDFFDDMLAGFPELMPEMSRAPSKSLGRSAPEILKVYEVGEYNASFIPTLNDFDRLDPQFKLSRQVWERLPKYQSYGFAVFKLRAPDHGKERYISATEDNPYADRWSRLPSSRMKRPHPMAFEFVTRFPDKLFFPTIHIHDGQVHEVADFDHHLYYQDDGFSKSPTSTQVVRSEEIASEFMDVTKTMGLVDEQQRCNAFVMSGRFPNQDTVIATA
ncbi:hypothetical protein PGN35_026345 [Nodosilinea sp. PGN35]|uniref:hypothetical protein n=1 Tax=Nodosilinea sp. PGN35 TaxID=3020489 RepID=UPI00398A642A